MPKNRVTIQIDMEDMVKNLEKAGADVRESIGAMLRESKKLVTDALVRDTVKENYPAQGKYSREKGGLAESIDRDESVVWDGYTAEIKVGYDFSKSGMESIMLMYGTKKNGTPRTKKAAKLYDDIYGSKIRKQIAEIQQKKLDEILEKAVKG